MKSTRPEFDLGYGLLRSWSHLAFFLACGYPDPDKQQTRSLFVDDFVSELTDHELNLDIRTLDNQLIIKASKQ